MSEYTIQRDVVLVTFDTEEYRNFLKKWNPAMAAQVADYDDQVIKATMCKLICDAKYLPEVSRRYAAKWLKENKFSEDIN
ncbi:MAG: hypothetical protein MJZ37_00915 [Bacilli bacterium]|nr:hypothetical protein [Bacilli bacterium]